MPENSRPLTAVHYFYLLKSDEDDLTRLWSVLTGGAGDGAGTLPSLRLDAGIEKPLPSLDLMSAHGEGGGRCQIVHRVDSEMTSFCLCMLPDIAAIEVNYARRSEELAPDWREAVEAIEADRDRLLSQVEGVFGETTVLLAPAGTEPAAIAAAAAVSSPMLTTGLKTAIVGPAGKLFHFPEMSARGRDYYAVACEKPEALVATEFPGLDTVIKKLNRTSAYFAEQRQTIISERAGVDREVGALLHRQVVTGAGAIETATLEEQINSLSRMFGLLATDSMLVRQAADRIERDIDSLDLEIERLAEPGATDEIGEFYMSLFSLDLGRAQAESHDLDFSRQSAQAAIEVVRTQVEIMRAGEEAAIQQQSKEILSRSLVLQKERLALQVAAGFIEFVLIFYYVLKSWEGIAGIEPVEHISPLLRLLVIGGFSGSAAIGTHFLAQVLQGQSWKNWGLWLSVSALSISLAGMVILTEAYV